MLGGQPTCLHSTYILILCRTRRSVVCTIKQQDTSISFKSCKVWGGFPRIKRLDWDCGNLESKSVPWTLCNFPQTISEQFLQCFRTHSPEDRGHCQCHRECCCLTQCFVQSFHLLHSLYPYLLAGHGGRCVLNHFCEPIQVYWKINLRFRGTVAPPKYFCTKPLKVHNWFKWSVFPFFTNAFPHSPHTWAIGPGRSWIRGKS